MQAPRPAVPQLRYQLNSVEDRGKCPTVPQRRELVTGTCTAGQGSSVSKIICFFKWLNNVLQRVRIARNAGRCTS